MRKDPIKKSEQTKQRILLSAKKLFTYSSYDQVGLREIAKDAGVDVALINRYFGSKKQLYQAVIDLVYKTPTGNNSVASKSSMFESQDIGLLLAQFMLKMQDNPIYAERNNLFMQSITNEVTAEIIGPQYYDCFIKQIEIVIPSADAKMKAELITSLVIGSSAIFALFNRNIQTDYKQEEFIQTFAKMINSIL